MNSSHGSSYVGRFAPSPTGPLHLGSLLAAVASYVDARANSGCWLLRMEDIDPPREPPEAADTILQQLEALALHWDGDVLYQSTRLDSYAAALSELQAKDLCFRCDCSRQRVKALGSVYDGHCRHRKDPPQSDFALRILTDDRIVKFEDMIQGVYQQQLGKDVGDFVLLRRDGRFSYQLAVVVDDAFQGITHVVRGTDLLDSTPRQIYLQELLGCSTPHYAHIPIIINEKGQKLSKQHFAPSIDPHRAGELLACCLSALGLSPPEDLSLAKPAEILTWAVQHWDIHAVPRLANIPQQQLPLQDF